MSRSSLGKSVVTALMLVSVVASAAPADKPPKIPVALGSWTGPGAPGIKSAVRRAIAKDCVVVPKKKARAVIEGTVEGPPAGSKSKAVVVHLRVRAAKTDEVVEQKDFTLPRPNPSSSQAAKMGKAAVEISRRAPDPDAPAP